MPRGGRNLCAQGGKRVSISFFLCRGLRYDLVRKWLKKNTNFQRLSIENEEKAHKGRSKTIHPVF